MESEMKYSDLKILEVFEYLEGFAKERDWCKYKTPKNLSMALAVEVAELVEIFQWDDNSDAESMLGDSEVMEKVKGELADIFSYLFQLAQVLKIDLVKEFWGKAKLNEIKYPKSKNI